MSPLVMTSEVQGGRSDVIRKGATPEFANLCSILYGDAIDPDEVWDDVAKAGPDQADVNAHSGATRQILRGTALTGAALGGYLGVKEGREGYRHAAAELGQPRRGPKVGGVRPPKVAPFSVKAARGAIKAGAKLGGPTKRKLAVAGALLPMDALEIGVIGSDLHSARKSKSLMATGRQAGAKSAALGIPPLKDTIAGTKKMAGKIAGMLRPTGKAVTPTTMPASGQSMLPGMDTAALPNAPGRIERGARKTASAIHRTATTSEGRTSAAVGGAGLLVTQKAGKKARNSAGGGGDMGGYYGTKAASAGDDVEWYGEFSKFDQDKHLAFGWASVSKVNGQPVVDKQNDYIDPDDLETAAYQYVLGSRVGGAMHGRDEFDQPLKVADLVESMVFTDDKVEAMGLPPTFNRGWWVGMKIHDPNEWELVKKGAAGGRTGFSIHGRGIRRDQDMDELMYGYR